MISCVCTGILLWKEDRKVIQVFGPLTPPTPRRRLGMVELEDLGKKLLRWIRSTYCILYPGDGRRRWAFFADG